MRTLSHNQQTTIFGIVFWFLFLASIGLVDSDRWLWLKAAWFFLGWDIRSGCFRLLDRGNVQESQSFD